MGPTCLATPSHLNHIKLIIVLKSLMSVAPQLRRELSISIHASRHSWTGKKNVILGMVKRFILSCILGKKKKSTTKLSNTQTAHKTTPTEKTAVNFTALPTEIICVSFQSYIFAGRGVNLPESASHWLRGLL